MSLFTCREFAIALAFAWGAASSAGPLTPPGGAPAPTYKTLQEVEPRTPVDGQVVLFEPGSYYLTRDLNLPLGNAIRITSGDVTLDLNGFSITGPGDGPTPDYGIRVDANVSGRVTVRNGAIGGFTAGSIISLTTTTAGFVTVEDVFVDGGRDGGISIAGNGAVRRAAVQGFNRTGDGIQVGGRGVIEQCVVENTAGVGFFLGSGTIRDCVARNCDAGGFVLERGLIAACVASNSTIGAGFLLGDNQASDDSAVAEHCIAEDNAGPGFRTVGPATFIACRAVNNTGRGFQGNNNGLIFRDCAAQFNGDDGFLGGVRSVFESCVAENNAGDGFQVGSYSVLRGCIAAGGLEGFNGGAATANVYVHCVAEGTGSAGFDTGSSSHLEGCVARDAGGDGFTVGSNSTVIGCRAVNSTLDGFDVNAASNIMDSVATGNGEDGFDLFNDCRITGCLADGNGGGASGDPSFAGIRGTSDCAVDSNTVTDNPVGIIASSGALVIRNGLAGNGSTISATGSQIAPTVVSTNNVTNPLVNIAY